MNSNNKKLFRKIIIIAMLVLTASAGTFTFILSDVKKNLLTIQKPTSWKAYSSTDQRFAVNFPKEPVTEDKKLDIASANQSIDYQEISAEAKQAVYALSYIDFPSKWRLVGANTLLKKSFSLMLENEEGSPQLLSQEMTSHQGFPALDYLVQRGEEHVKGRLVLVGSTLYRLTVAYAPDMKDKIQHEQFVSSFVLNTL